jgi:leucyl aminopeptidase
VVELLPAQRDIRIFQRRAPLTESAMTKYDASIVICDREQAQETLAKLPFGATWQRLYAEAKARGPVSILSTRMTAEALPMVVVFTKATHSAFERLSLATRAWKELSPSPSAKVLFATHGLAADPSSAMLEAMTAAALAASAPMPVMKSKAPKSTEPPQLTLNGDGPDIDADLSVAIDRGNHLARWLTTLPPNVLHTSSYRKALRELAKREGWAFSFLDEAKLKRLNAGAFLAVTRANEHRDAGIVRLSYRAPRGEGARKKLALVGKGICFDTGGINLKPHKGMYQMHEDMQGSAVAVGTLLALSRLKVPYDIDCWLAITENQIGPNAFRPQEVVTAVNGVTIQVAHSDAEGRMVLADTLALASREKPDLMIDFATLTGACVTALTERYCGAFTNRPEWNAILEQAGRQSGERVWPFPMDEDFDSDLESSIADVLHCTPDSKGDHILAARFLNHFVPKETPWIHIDLAAGNRSGGLAHVPTDFTGFGVRYTTLLLKNDLLSSAGAVKKKKKSAG